MMPVAGLMGCAATHAYPDGTGLEGQLERELAAQRLMLATCQEQLRSGASDDGGMYTTLVQAFSGTEVEVARDGASVMVTIPGRLLFTPDFQMRNESMFALDLVSTALRTDTRWLVDVEAHTSDAPLPPAIRAIWPGPWELCYAQAWLVMRTLVDRFGVAEARFRVTSAGTTSPVVSNDTTAGQARNERMVLILRPMESP